MFLSEPLKEEREKGLRDGLQKGRQEGRQEGRREVIFNMLQAKADVSFISKVTGLPEREIRELKNGS